MSMTAAFQGVITLEPYTTNVYYYSPEVGTTYRFHAYMRVVDSNGYLHDAETINSDSYVYRG